MTNRWITVYFDGDYDKNKYKNIFAAYIHPVVKTFEGTNGKCVTFQNMTEAEYKFTSEKIVKEASRVINKSLKSLPKSIFEGKRMAMVMPSYYEKNGSRGIVRPDYHSDPLPTKNIKNFSKLKLPKKYLERDSPPLPANDYCNIKIKGSDGIIYSSIKNNKGICQWKKM